MLQPTTPPPITTTLAVRGRSMRDMEDIVPCLSLRALADYAGLSVKTLRKHFDADPDDALPCYRVGGGKILVRRSEYDLWIAAKRCVGRPSLAKAVREIGLG